MLYELGRVIEVLPQGIFRVECRRDGLVVLCKLSQEILKTCINPRIKVNDMVDIRISNHTLYDGEIVYHHI